MTDQALDDNILTWRARDRVGAVLRGKWRLDRLLGVGGMAAVYEGTHRNGKRGAVKVLHLELSMHPDARARFLQEGYVANRVDHPGAVSVLDDDVAEDGSVFLVMELLDGRTLEEIAATRPGRRLGAAEALALADQLLDVLAAAHDKGIVHRDLKPENLFLTRDGRLKVLDFGLARVREVPGARLTRTGNAMGTPAFLPPEQAQGQWDQVDGRTDLWAAGATLFTLLTGRLVHEASNLNQLLLAAMTHSAPSLRSVAPDVPRPVAAIVDRALAFERKARWEDARAMQRAVREARRALQPADLAALLAGALAGALTAEEDGAFEKNPTLLASAVSRDAPPRPAKRAWIAAAGAGAALLAGVIVLIASREAPSTVPIAASGAQPSIEAVAPLLEPAPTPVAPAPAQPELAPPASSPEATTSAAPHAPPAEPRVKPTSGRSTAGPQPGSSAAPQAGSTAKDPFLKGFN